MNYGKTVRKQPVLNLNCRRGAKGLEHYDVHMYMYMWWYMYVHLYAYYKEGTYCRYIWTHVVPMVHVYARKMFLLSNYIKIYT